MICYPPPLKSWGDIYPTPPPGLGAPDCKRHVLIYPYSMRYALSVESRELFRGVRGAYSPPVNFKKMIQLAPIKVLFQLDFKAKISWKYICTTTTTLQWLNFNLKIAWNITSIELISIWKLSCNSIILQLSFLLLRFEKEISC